MAKLLWISTHPPFSGSRHAGGQSFNYYFHEFIKSGHFDIKLLCVGETAYRDQIEDELKPIDHSCFYPQSAAADRIKKIKNVSYYFNPFQKYGRTTSNYWGDGLFALVKKAHASGYRPDAIILEWTACVLMLPRIRQLFDVPCIGVEHDVVFMGLQRKVEFFKSHKLYRKLLYANEKQKELSALKECSLIMLLNGENEKVLNEEGVHRPCLWLKPYYHRMDHVVRKPEGRDILYFGAMSRPENYLSAIWFIENVMPLIQDCHCRFVILGADGENRLKQYEGDSVVVMGFVQDIDPYFAGSMCFVAPLVLGAGIKIKVIEALSSGIPVLTNDIGIEGIPAVDGKDYYHCTSAQEYADRIRSIVEGHADHLAVGINAVRFCTENFNYETTSKEYIKAVSELVKK